MRCPSCVPPGSRNSCSDKPPGPPCGPVFHRCPQAAEFLTPVGGGAMRPFAPAHGGGRGEAAAGMQNPTNHGAAAETDGAAHPAAGPTGGPAKCSGIKGDRDARRQARAAHPRRAAHSQARAARPTPALLWGLAGPRPPGGPRTDRRRPETARPHTHQATPTAPATTRPTPGRGKPGNSHKRRRSPPTGPHTFLRPGRRAGTTGRKAGRRPLWTLPQWAARKCGAETIPRRGSREAAAAAQAAAQAAGRRARPAISPGGIVLDHGPAHANAAAAGAVNTASLPTACRHPAGHNIPLSVVWSKLSACAFCPI